MNYDYVLLIIIVLALIINSLIKNKEQFQLNVPCISPKISMYQLIIYLNSITVIFKHEILSV